MCTTIITSRMAIDGTVIEVYRWHRSFWVGERSRNNDRLVPLPDAQFWTIDHALTRLHEEVAKRAQPSQES